MRESNDLTSLYASIPKRLLFSFYLHTLQHDMPYVESLENFPSEKFELR